ncbi:hypothetical protein D3C71_1587740 [compost metagenome]
MRLFGLGHAQFALRHQFDAQGSEQGGELAQLAGIIGRQHDAAQGIGNLGGSHRANCIGRSPPAPPGCAIPLRREWALKSPHEDNSLPAAATTQTYFVVTIANLVTDRI